QLRRGAARGRLAAADRAPPRGDAGQLAARPGRDHRRLGLGGGGAAALPRGLERAAPLPAPRAAPALTRSGRTTSPPPQGASPCRDEERRWRRCSPPAP